MARIDYASFVGQTFTNDKTHDRYLVKEYLGDKLYTIHFVDENGVFLKGHEQTAEKYANVVKGKCKDLKAKKIASAIKKKQQYTSRNRCTRKSVENYERIPDLSSKVVMSIDGSTNCTGWAINKCKRKHKIEYISIPPRYYYGQIEPTKTEPTAQRMIYTASEIQRLITQYGVEVIFYEDVIFKNVNVMKILGRLQGMVEYIALKNNCKFISINPSSWKNYLGFTGERESQKKQSIERASQINTLPMREDEADAFNMLDYCMTLEKKED